MSTPIESLLLDEIVQWGDPWHGLWRGDDLKIHTPHGPVVDCPGQAPDYAPWGTNGDCWKLAIPGITAPTNDAADVTAGRTWLNHAIVSGHYQRLYGKPGAAIYLDPANKPWLIQLSPSWSFSGSPAINGTATISLNLIEFGMIGETAISQSLAAQSVNFSILTPTAGAESMWIEDMTTDGRSLIFYVCCGYANDVRRCLGLFKLDISGTPPAASFTWSKIADEAGNTTPLSTTGGLTYKHGMFASGAWTYDTTTNGISAIVVGGIRFIVGASFSRSSSNLVGARFIGSSVQILKFDINETVTATGGWSGTGGSSSYSGSGSAACTCTFALKAGSTTIASQTSTTTTDVTYSGDIYASTMNGVVTGSKSFAGLTDTVNYTGPSWTPLWEVLGSWPFVGLPPIVSAVSGNVKPHRYSNALYGLVYSAGSTVKFMSCAGKITTDSSIKSATTYTGGPRYASEHPVTGQIAWDTVPVCWV
jgi:hypothetical protein